MVAAEVVGAGDAVPDALVDPGGVIIPEQVDGEPLAFDGGVIVGIFGYEIVESELGSPVGALLGDGEWRVSAGAA